MNLMSNLLRGRDDRAIELQDAKVVDRAIDNIVAGRFDRAEKLLGKVIQNTPSNYEFQREHENILYIKFWDVDEFVHYVTWQHAQGQDRSVTWLPSAYPRAFYHLAFVKVHNGDYERAIDLLEDGQTIEPTNPKFVHEKSQALIRLGRYNQALHLLSNFGPIGPFVSGHDMARAFRTRGFALIELQLLDDAELAFNESLEFDPGSEVAHNELDYIKHLRAGGPKALSQPVQYQSQGVICSYCGEHVDKGQVTIARGVPQAICDRCRSQHAQMGLDS